MLRLEPFSKMVKDAVTQNTYTKDIAELQSKFVTCPVLVWGTEKNRYIDHDNLLKGYLPVAYGWTPSAYVLRIHKTQRCPAVFYEPTNPAAAKVYGEIYMLPIERIMALDCFHMNGHFMQRRWRLINYHLSASHPAPENYFQKDVFMYTAIKDSHDVSQYEEGPLVNSSQPYFLWRITDDAKYEQAFKAGGKRLPF